MGELQNHAARRCLPKMPQKSSTTRVMRGNVKMSTYMYIRRRAYSVNAVIISHEFDRTYSRTAPYV